MILQQLSVQNFKNCRTEQYTFAENLNCIIGRNGIGKTNLLDAIYYSSFCKSYFSLTDAMCITVGEQFFSISALFSSLGVSDTIHLFYSGDKEKKVSCNGKKYQKLSDHIGKFPSIMVTPSDIALIDGGSAERRRFLDIFISQFDAEYLHSLVVYNKLLDSRNRILKEMRQGDLRNKDIVDVYDLQLGDVALVIDIARKRAVNEISPKFSFYYQLISGGYEDVGVEYFSDTDYSDFYSILKTNFSRDAAIGHTTKGVHRDDLQFALNGQTLKQCGSQGQKKTFLLALTFAKYSFIYSKTGVKPILLLDDLFDKLDKDRMSSIIEIVSGQDFGQIFITDTNRDSVKDILLRFDGRNKMLDFG